MLERHTCPNNRQRPSQILDLKGTRVPHRPRWSRIGNQKWECGACAPAHNSAAAPATVGGESPAIGATGKCSVSREGGRKRRPASQETCHRVMSHARLRRTGCADVRRTAVAHTLPRRRQGAGRPKSRGDGGMFAVGAWHVACQLDWPQSRPDFSVEACSGF